MRESLKRRDATISHLGKLGMLGKVVIALGLENALCAREQKSEFRSPLSEREQGEIIHYKPCTIPEVLLSPSLAAAAHANISTD